MKTIIYLCMMGLLLFGSCSREEYLDFQPRGVTIPSTLKDFRSLLDQVDEFQEGESSSLGFGKMHENSIFLSDNQILTEALINNFKVDAIKTRAYLFEDNFFSSIDNDADWETYYNHIYVSNIVLAGLEKVTDGTEQEINQLRGEARLHRAFAYFNLVNLYGLHYNPATAQSDLGVPVRMGVALENVDLTRASVQKVYDLIITDITKSINNLIDIQPAETTFRPSKAAAYGLLSKVKLYQSKYDEALQAARMALEGNNKIRDINIDDNEEDLVISAPSVKEDEQIIWYKYAPEGNAFPSEELINLYEENDLRVRWYASVRALFGNDVDELVYYAFSGNDTNTDGITTPDIYLVSAECNVRLGNVTAANNDLNALREKRFRTGEYVPLDIQDPARLLQVVKQERRREMANSTQRIFDIKRYNLFDNDNISVTHVLRGVAATLRPNSINWALPIAPKYIQLNPEIVQNPRE